MSIRAYRIVSLTLGGIILLLAWKYWALYGEIINAQFVAAQAENLRASIRAASEGRAGADSVLYSLDFYLDYYDHKTNALAGSGLLVLLRRDRECVVTEAIAYLRKNGTNDFGDDPYKWLPKSVD